MRQDLPAKSRNFLGFGLGAIQTGLFLWEAQESGNFNRLSVVEVNLSLIDAIKKANGQLWLNIARKQGCESVLVENVEILHPQRDFELIGQRIAEADELSTAIPSVDFFGKGGAFSIASLLANFATPNKERVLYCAENNNHAAEILETLVREISPNYSGCQFVNTVVGKMSGLIVEVNEIKKCNMKEFIPEAGKAWLVEEFNRILISKLSSTDFVCGFPNFVQKSDLLPFEEAKLFGHNCVHAWLGYHADELDLKSMSELSGYPKLMAEAQSVFMDECGQALIKKYQGMDELFSHEGWKHYALDLLERMVNPWLLDGVMRVCRDPDRKLQITDRLCGTANLVLEQGFHPTGLIRGIKSGLRFVRKNQPEKIQKTDRELLISIWKSVKLNSIQEKLLKFMD